MTKKRSGKKISKRRKTSKRSKWNVFVKKNFKHLRKLHPGWPSGKIFHKLSEMYTPGHHKKSSRKRKSRKS